VNSLRAFVLFVVALVAAAPVQAADPENTLVLRLQHGEVHIQLLPNLAPGHVERVKKLARENFYNGIIFHRVIPDFMAQSGDPEGTGRGGSKYEDLKAEFTGYVFRRGTVGAARTSNPHSANSQFFICFNEGCRHLTGQYTVWGQVSKGMEHVDSIAPGQPPQNPDRIIEAYILADKS
jgi:peptidylprolyl isomerase